MADATLRNVRHSRGKMGNLQNPYVRLDELNRDEFYQAVRKILPDMDPEGFNEQWAHFVEWKRRREMQ